MVYMEPTALGIEPFLVSWLGVLTALSHVARKDAICPFVGVGVELAVQLAHRDTFRVQSHNVYLFKALLLPQRSHSRSQDPVVGALPAHGRAHEHQPVAHDRGFVKLYNFAQEGPYRLHLLLLASNLHGTNQFII